MAAAEPDDLALSIKNPIYAGAYAYGRRQVDRRRQVGLGGQARPSGRSRATILATAWHAFLPDRYPAYIAWEAFEQHQAQLRANQARAAARGAVRRGPALLAGLLVCGRCGHRLLVRYSGGASGGHGTLPRSVPPAAPARRGTYVCARLRSDDGGPDCQQVAGPALERFVSQQALVALAPAALELSLAAAHTLERDRADLVQLWQQRRERATYEADRAGRQFHLVDPEHRLVARQLERQWEAKLAAQQQLEEEYDRFLRHQPHVLSNAERAAIRQLASDLPALWHAPTTTDAERKTLLRPLIEQIVVDVVGDRERVQVTITWAGGAQTHGVLIRPVARLAQLSTYPALCTRVQTLASEGLRPAAIADRLNAEGFHPPKRREQFGRQGITDLLRQLGLDTPQSRSRARTGLASDEWWLPELARTVPMPDITLYDWIRRGWVQARQQRLHPRRWIIWADTAEVTRLRTRHQRPAGEDA